MGYSQDMPSISMLIIRILTIPPYELDIVGWFGVYPMIRLLADSHELSRFSAAADPGVLR